MNRQAGNKTVDVPYQDIAGLFAVDRTAITKHIRNIFNDGQPPTAYRSGGLKKPVDKQGLNYV